MLSILIPLFIAILGALVYAFATNNAKLAEIGRIMFACGMLVTTWYLAGHTIHFG